ncbi:MAG: hypothetical protein DWI02_00535 [Planctomycetota bacterium]|nr:MAG: hypothetical protein DWI02_00535 [Planctomycetota bacterium]
MFVPFTTDHSFFPHGQLMQQLLSTLQRGVASHIKQETRLHRLFASCQEQWLTQSEQLRSRIEMLEARLAPWMVDRTERVGEQPRLVVVAPQDEAA